MPVATQICTITAKCIIPDTDFSTGDHPDLFTITSVTDSEGVTKFTVGKKNETVHAIQSSMCSALRDYLSGYLEGAEFSLDPLTLTYSKPSTPFDKYNAKAIERKVNTLISSVFQQYATKYGTGKWKLGRWGLVVPRALDGKSVQSVGNIS